MRSSVFFLTLYIIILHICAAVIICQFWFHWAVVFRLMGTATRLKLNGPKSNRTGQYNFSPIKKRSRDLRSRPARRSVGALFNENLGL